MTRLITPLPTRLALFTIAPLLLTMAIGGLLLLATLENALEASMQRELKTVARAIQLPLAHAVERGRQGTIDRSLESVFSIGGVYGAYLYDKEGTLLAALGRAQSQRDRTRVAEAVDSGEDVGAYGEIGDREVYAQYVPLVGSERGTVGMLQVTRRASDIRRSMKRLRMFGGAGLALMGLLLTLIVLAGYYGSVGSALGKLRSSMEKIEAGDPLHRAAIFGPPEIRVLARSMNAMLDSIERAHDAIRREQQSRARLEGRLKQSEKLAAIGQLAAGVAHELGTPLSTVAGRAQRSLRSHQLDRSTRHTLEIVRSEVGRMERLVRQLLDFGRANSTQRLRVSGQRLLSGASRALEDEIERRNIQVDVEWDDAPKLLVDPPRIEQAMINLIKNALQSAATRVKVSLVVDDEAVILLVDDDGEGISSDVRDRVFEPFFTTKGQQGTGLGLSIVDSVAREHGGRLWTARSPLGGARFCMSIPKGEEEVRCP